MDKNPLGQYRVSSRPEDRKNSDDYVLSHEE